MADAKTEKRKPLSPKHRQFVTEYLECFNATEAYDRVYHPKSRDGAAASAAALLRNPKIAEAIDERLEAEAMRSSEVLARLADAARGSMADFVSFANLEPYPEFILDLGKAERLGKLHLIKSIKYDRHGRPSIELYSALDAQKTIADLLTKGPTGAADDPVHVKVIEGPKDVR